MEFMTDKDFFQYFYDEYGSTFEFKMGYQMGYSKAVNLICDAFVNRYKEKAKKQKVSLTYQDITEIKDIVMDEFDNINRQTRLAAEQERKK